MVRPRVLALTKSTGGIAFYNRMLLSELHARGVASHTVCLSENAADYAAELASHGLGSEVVEMARYRIDPLGDLAALRRVVAAARRERAQVIVCHGSKPSVLGRAAARMLGLPAVYRQASMPFLRRVQGRRAPLYWAIELAARPLGGTMVALTEQARQETIAKGLAAAGRVRVIRTGVDVERFRPRGDRDARARALGLDPSRPIVGWIGRMEPQKAPLDFLAAVRQVAPSRPVVQFVMAGDGRLGPEVERRVAEWGLGGRVHLLPWQADPAPVLRAFDVYVLSSRWEGLPLTLLEAMASGCAPVSTDVDGCMDAIEPGVSGATVPAAAPERLADALGAMLDDPARRRAVGEEARRRAVALFDKRRMVSEWEALLADLCAGGWPAGAGAIAGAAGPAR